MSGNVKVIELSFVRHWFLLQIVKTLARQMLLEWYAFDSMSGGRYSLGLFGASSFYSYLVDSVGFSLP
jgi:hypothetical protein